MYSFPDLEPVCWSMSSFNCCFLTCIEISLEAGQVVWYAHLFQNFPQFIVIHIVKGFGIVNKAEVDVFSGTLLLFSWSSRCWQFDLWFLCLFQNQLEHLKYMVHILLKPGLENFEHYFTSVWVECNCAVVWAFFGIAFLWDWNKNWPFPVLWPLLSFPNLLAYWVQHFHSIIFRIWNSSTGIPSLPLALFVVMLPKAHLTLDSRMSGHI